MKRDFNMDREILIDLYQPQDTKIILFVLDGLGGVQKKDGGLTELEAARTPNLNKLAAEGMCGLHQPIGPGITPGSGPAHLALFGYDPLKFEVGRGVLSALGINFELNPADVAARGNFCTIDEKGRVKDRRAGRINTEKNKQLCEVLREIELPEVEIFIETVKEHRFLFVLRGDDLSGKVSDTDPQALNVEPKPPKPQDYEASKTAALVSVFLEQAMKKLSQHHPANMVLLRGFSQKPEWPSFKESFGLKAAAIAGYPMYRGVAKLVGMSILNNKSDQLEDEIKVMKEAWNDYEFFFIHYKATDSAGEDGDFERKAALIEEVDKAVPKLLEVDPDVLIITGDHSTPTSLKSHSWHPVPVLLWSKNCRIDPVREFGERACMSGGLGVNFPAVNLMPLALAESGRLKKYGA